MDKSEHKRILEIVKTYQKAFYALADQLLNSKIECNSNCPKGRHAHAYLPDGRKINCTLETPQ